MVRFTIAKGRKGVEMGCRIEQKEDEMKDRICNGEKKKSGKGVFVAFVRAHLHLERYNVL